MKKIEKQQNRELNRATLKFAEQLSQVILEKDSDLFVSVNMRNQETTGLGNVEITNFKGNLVAAIWFTLYLGNGGDYMINCSDTNPRINTIVTDSELYATAEEIVGGI